MFLSGFIHHTFARLWVELHPSEAFQMCAKALQRWSLTVFFLSWQTELFLASKFLLGTEQHWPGEWVYADKMRLSSFSSCAFILVFFFFSPWCCYNSKVDSRGLLALFLFMDSCPIIYLCREMGKLDSLTMLFFPWSQFQIF